MSAPYQPRVKSFNSVSAEEDLRGILGAALAADWRQAFVVRGYGWNVTVGALSTPIVGGGNGTVLDAEQPELAIAVPAGYCMVPLRTAVEVELGIQTTDSHVTEILIGVDRTQLPTAGTSTLETPVNMRTDVASTCPLTVRSAYTADTITPVLDELDRAQVLTDVQGTAATVNAYQLKTVYEPGVSPIIVGPAGFYVYFGGDIAASGFIQASFLALPANLFTGLS